MAMSIEPLAPHIGARVDGIDLGAPVSDEDADALRHALVDRLVLVFRGQDLSEAYQIRFCALFGPISRHLRPAGLRTEADDTPPAVMMVTNERRDGKPVGYLPDGELMFHTDSCFREIPQRAVSLYGIAVTRDGGRTKFASACRLYDTLPDDLKAELAGRRAVNAYEFGVTVKTVPAFDRSKWPHFAHPVIARDERDGRTYLYANELMTEEIEGLDAGRNREILDRLFAHVRNSPDSYVHVWARGDLVLWDNRRALHARTDFPADQARKLRRVPIDDDRPVLAA
jgi:taurine dioxygenase